MTQTDERKCRVVNRVDEVVSIHQHFHDGEEWRITLHWLPDQDRSEATSMLIEHSTLDRPISAAVVRSIPTSTLLLDAIEEAQRMQVVAGKIKERMDEVEATGQELTESEVRLWLRFEGAAQLAGARQGPRSGAALTEVDLKAVAAVYREAWAARRSTVKAVQEAFSIAPGTAAKRIAKARAEGLLDGVGRGAK